MNAAPHHHLPAPADPSRLTTIAAIRAALFAGNATLTIVSKRTHTRFTYRVKRGDAGWFVALLTGPNNETDYRYLGMINRTRTHIAPTTNSPEGATGMPGWIAFAWLLDVMTRDGDLAQLEVWHNGRCCRCGRTLTVPASIATGLGPECAAILAS